jgi:hypothetical protein
MGCKGGQSKRQSNWASAFPWQRWRRVFGVRRDLPQAVRPAASQSLSACIAAPLIRDKAKELFILSNGCEGKFMRPMRRLDPQGVRIGGVGGDLSR